MGQFDYLVPGSTVKAPTSTGPVGGQFASLIPKAAPAVPATPGLGYKVGAPIIDGAKMFGSDVWNALTASPADTTKGPVQFNGEKSISSDIAMSAINTYASSLKDTTDRFAKALSTVTDAHTTALQKGVSAGEAGVGALNLFFAPISAFLNGTSHIPVVGKISTAVNNVFSAIGTGGADLGEGAIDALPVSDETKATLMPLAKELSALAAQIVAGKGTADTFDAVKTKTETFMNTVHDQIRVAQATVDNNLPRQVPVAGDSVETPVPNANKYTPDAQLPVIDVGATPKDTSGLPSIQMDATTPDGKLPGYKVEPITPTPAAATTPDVSAPTSEATAPTKTAARPVENAPTVPTDTPTKGALDISANLVKGGEAALTSDEMASYKSGSYKDSAATAETLKTQDPEALKQMAITGKGIPEGVFPKILYNLVEKDAIESKDYALQRELAKSPLNTEASTHAGQLGAGGYNAVKDSPVKVIKEAIEKKAGGAKGKEKIAAEAKKAKSTITKSAKQMMDYKSILDAIKTC